MARTTIQIKHKYTYQEAKEKLEKYLSWNNFQPVAYNGEQVWKKGTGLLTAMQYIKMEFGEDYVCLSAWIRAGVGGFGGDEMDLTGSLGALPKRSLMNLLEELKRTLQS